MKNITLSIDEDVLARVRMVAAERRTSVNALIREHMNELAKDTDRLAQAKRQLRELSERTEVDLGEGFSREDAYRGRDFPRHERADLRGNGEKV